MEIRNNRPNELPVPIVKENDMTPSKQPNNNKSNHIELIAADNILVVCNVSCVIHST